MNQISTHDAKEASIDDLLKSLSSSETGLSVAEAEHRLREVGPNEIVEKKANPIVKFLLYFWGPIPWMIEAAAVISIIIHHISDFFIISAL
ncbi:MAG: metal-transporting ATPase, partial [Theionarchaea archaeon]|nr:metal-transporting ATPase [Theionarchaea archaeon]